MMKGLERKLELAAQNHVYVEEAQRIHGLMEDIIHHTHNLARQFSSLDVKGDDLCAVLKGLAANVKKLFEIACGFSVKGRPPELPQHTTVQLYKIAQEAVSNAIKHGKASQVSIGLVSQNGQLVMSIKNDGVPFAQPSGASTRMGLRIMHYRANTIGARLEIKALGKSGTIVTCTLPVQLNSRGVRQAGGHSELPIPNQSFKELEPEDVLPGGAQP
jgi:signal transduction histidine kinase